MMTSETKKNAIDTLTALIKDYKNALDFDTGDTLSHFSAAQYLANAAVDALTDIENELKNVAALGNTHIDPDNCNNNSPSMVTAPEFPRDPYNEYPVCSDYRSFDKPTPPIVMDIIFREICRILSVTDPTRSSRIFSSEDYFFNNSNFLGIVVTTQQWDDTCNWISRHPNCKIQAVYEDDEWNLRWKSEKEIGDFNNNDDDPF